MTLLGILFAPYVIAVLAPGFPAEKAALTIQLTRIMFPFILLVSLAALVMGMLNAKNVFGMPALASSFFNVGSIVGGVAFCYWLDPQANWRHPHFGERGLVGLAIGSLLGGLLQLLVQLPSAHGVGFRFRFDFHWRDPGVRTILALMGPATIAASAVQVNVAVNSGFRLLVRQRADHLAEHRVSPDAVAARRLRRRGRYRHAAVDFPERGDGEHAGIPRRAFARDAARDAAHDSVRHRAHHSRAADHRGDLSTRTFHAGIDRADRFGVAILRDRAGGVCGRQSARAGLLRAR